jgi:hypothetical protein
VAEIYALPHITITIIITTIHTTISTTTATATNNGRGTI